MAKGLLPHGRRRRAQRAQRAKASPVVFPWGKPRREMAAMLRFAMGASKKYKQKCFHVFIWQARRINILEMFSTPQRRQSCWSVYPRKSKTMKTAWP
jgi:hypothetical protein